MEGQYSHEVPERIDIYVDGTWLHAGKNNTVGVGAWAGVIVETYADGHQESWMPSKPVLEGKSAEAEFQAVLGSLRAVVEREKHRAVDLQERLPTMELTVHTDSPALINRIMAKPNSHPQGQEFKALVETLGVDIRYGSHDKTGKGRKRNSHPEIGAAHEEGHRVAWSERARLQGNKIHSHGVGWIDTSSDTPER